MSDHAEHIKDLESLIATLKRVSVDYPDDIALKFSLSQCEGMKAKLEEEHWVCVDCGAEGYGAHGCPGRPGENQF